MHTVEMHHHADFGEDRSDRCEIRAWAAVDQMKWVNEGSCGLWVSTCDPLTNDPLTDD